MHALGAVLGSEEGHSLFEVPVPCCLVPILPSGKCLRGWWGWHHGLPGPLQRSPCRHESLWLLGTAPRMASIHSWNTSWLILAPKGILRKRSRPLCELNVVKREASCIRCICRYRDDLLFYQVVQFLVYCLLWLNWHLPSCVCCWLDCRVHPDVILTLEAAKSVKRVGV